MPLIVSPATDGSARASCSSPVFAGFRSIRRGGRRQKTSNRRPRRSWLRWPRATATRQDWPPIGHQIGPKVTSLQANRGYRYRDSNPGFRRERAAEHPAPSRKIRHFQGKHELGGIAQRPNGSGDVRIWFGGPFSSRSRFQALQPDCRLARRRAHSTSPSPEFRRSGAHEILKSPGNTGDGGLCALVRRVSTGPDGLGELLWGHA